MYDVIEKIRSANPRRALQNLARKMIKLSEECGEASEAYLYVTTEINHKEKTWDDLREEAIDTAIVGIDIALTRLPIDADLTDAEIREAVDKMFQKKLDKWMKKLANNQDATLSEK